MEEQTVTTNEMARSVAEAAQGSNQIVQNITGVAQAAQSAAGGATETQTAAQELARLAAELRAAVDQFKYNDACHERGPAGTAKLIKREALTIRSRPTYDPAPSNLETR